MDHRTCVHVCVCVCIYVYLGVCLYVYECIDIYIMCTYVCLLRACIHVNMSISGFMGQGEQVKFTNTGNPRGFLLLFEMDSEDRRGGIKALLLSGTLPVHTYCGHKWAAIWSTQLTNPTRVLVLSSLLVPTGGKAKATSVFPSPHMPWSQHGQSALGHVGRAPVYLQRKPQLPCKAQN